MKVIKKQEREMRDAATLIVAQVKDTETESTQEFMFRHTKHSMERAQQRGICGDKLGIILAYGEPVYKQGLLYYILGEQNIPEELERRKDEFRNTVVVVNGSSDKVLTCYRSKKPFKHIRKKSKTLYNRYHAA